MPSAFTAATRAWRRRNPYAPVAFGWAPRGGGAGRVAARGTITLRPGVARARRAVEGATLTRLWLDILGRAAPRRRAFPSNRANTPCSGVAGRRAPGKAHIQLALVKATGKRARRGSTRRPVEWAPRWKISFRRAPIQDSIARSGASFRARAPSRGTPAPS